MNNRSLVSAYAAKVASLGGFLDGISYLNQNRRSDFAEAFVVEAPDKCLFPEYIQTRFSHLTGMNVRSDTRFQGTMGQLEQDLKSLLLVNPIVDDEQSAEDMRSYLSFQIMDRLDEIINAWQRVDDYSSPPRYLPPKRFLATYDDMRGQMIFYLLRSGEVTFVLYFCSSKERF